MVSVERMTNVTHETRIDRSSSKTAPLPVRFLAATIGGCKTDRGVEFPAWKIPVESYCIDEL